MAQFASFPFSRQGHLARYSHLPSFRFHRHSVSLHSYQRRCRGDPDERAISSHYYPKEEALRRYPAMRELPHLNSWNAMFICMAVCTFLYLPFIAPRACG